MLAIIHRIGEAAIAEDVDHPPDRFLGIVLDMRHVGENRLQPELPDHLVKFLHALFICRQLRPKIGDILFGIAGRVDGAVQHLDHLGLAVGAGIDKLEIVDQDAFLVDMRGIRRCRAGCLAANIRVMPAAGTKNRMPSPSNTGVMTVMSRRCVPPL